jgi:N6-L-threonylcarbamoyladenine synthase
MLRPPEGGIHPREAANHHAKELPGLISQALDDAEIGHNELGLVAFSQGPGLGPCLRTAATAARALSLGCGIPIIGVNHCVAHIEIGRLVTKAEDPVLLYASGGNTQVIGYSRGKYRVFGETLDIGIGNMLDKFGREVGLAFPAGPTLEKLALGGEYMELPYSIKGMDVAFSGLMTAALSMHRKGKRLEDIAYSIQETAFGMLTEVTERAVAHIDNNEILLGGGVARNKRLIEMVGTMGEERGAEVFVPQGSLCVDNGVMIAWTGHLMHRAGATMEIAETVVDQNFRTDEVDVIWR